MPRLDIKPPGLVNRLNGECATRAILFPDNQSICQSNTLQSVLPLLLFISRQTQWALAVRLAYPPRSALTLKYISYTLLAACPV